jgi:hypothetical protein
VRLEPLEGRIVTAFAASERLQYLRLEEKESR